MSKNEVEKYLPFFKVNNRINILIPNEQQSDSDLIYHTSRIEDIDETGMMLAAPLFKGRPIELAENEIFYGQMPIEGAVYDFYCVFLGKMTQESLPFWRASLPYNIYRKQQRNFVRYDISLPVAVKAKDTENPDENHPVTFFRTKDISGGGLKLISKMALAQGAVFELTFNIPEYGEIMVDAKVVRVQKPQDDVKLFWIGCEFLNIVDRERTAIIQFIFKRQLEDRRKFVSGM
ncbi:MAG: PilZ domain-containing protein [Sporomusaceae bacterium]|jgi:c-di-GMP-binding flagellar brake protein YcgR|nr:PilZ domain-containing protein [Sporomusaceae bacterium]